MDRFEPGRALVLKPKPEVAQRLIAVRQRLGKASSCGDSGEKVNLDEAASAEVRREMEAFGVRVGSIAIRDLILPGDIREILNQVPTVEKQAQANLLNTANLMEDNPLLVRPFRFQYINPSNHKSNRLITR